MSETDPPRRRSMRRPFTPSTEAELDAAAEVTDDDVARARLAWRRNAQGALRDVLDARPLDP